MATQEKLLKSLEALKQLIGASQNTGTMNKRKEKVQHCNFIAEAMLNPTIKIAKNFNTLLSFTVDILLQLCDDAESDVRMTADECLNKIIRAMNNSNITKIQIELHKEIKHNGSARSLRAALWRFALLAHHIRPNKGKPYVVNLVPCIMKIFERSEELVHETLASSLPKIMAALGCFTMDNDVKGLLKACLNNIKNSSAVIRRTTASCILTICLNCRKPYIFITYVLNNLVDCLVPVQDCHATALILGTWGCLRAILPHIRGAEDGLKSQTSFGGRRDVGDNMLSIERLLQIYELCLHYSTHKDHNIINASLETLNVLLQNSSVDLKKALLSSNGVQKSRIYYNSTNKAKLRSPSQLSMATTLLSDDILLLDTDLSDTIRTDIEKWIDESKLAVINVNYVKDKTVDNVDTVEVNLQNTAAIEKCDYSDINIGTIQDQYADSVRSGSVTEQMDKLILSENSSEKSFSQKLDEKSLLITDNELLYLDIDIGDYLDKDIPLVFCARHIAKQFLLTGLPGETIPDKNIRVSIKNLALNCLSTILQIYPEVLVMHLDINAQRQQMVDVLLIADHCDPQLRGTVRILIASYLKSVIEQNCGSYHVDNCTALGIKNLLGIILKGLQDESSTCSRQTLGSLNIALRCLLESEISRDSLPILNYLPILAKDPYWLVKVKLLEIITDLNYITVQHVLGSKEFQNKVIHNVLFELLKDDDQRVRNATSIAIVKIIPLLYFEQDLSNETTVTCKAIYYRNTMFPTLANNDVDTNINKRHFIAAMPFPFSAARGEHCMRVEQSLSRFLLKLYQYLMTTTSKCYIMGCINTLNLLGVAYPTTLYKTAWNCFGSVSVQKGVLLRSTSIVGNIPLAQNTSLTTSADLLNVTMHLLTNGVVGYDLNCHLNLLKLVGQVFAGKWLQNVQLSPESISPRELWDIIDDKKLSELSEQFLNHVIKLLNIFGHVLDEATPVLPQAKPVLPNLPSASTLSPLKRKKSDLGDRKVLTPGKSGEKDEKAEKKLDVRFNAMGYFANVPHYMKIYEILRVAYNNYKVTLNSEASENFLSLLRTTLFTLSLILEVATLTETGRIADEILLYLRSTFNLEPTATVECVQHLLKSLFGTNLSSDIEGVVKYLEVQPDDEQLSNEGGFYHHIVQVPYDDITNCVSALNKVSKIECDGDSTVMGYLHRKENKKGANKGSDKILANYIRIFEPMVIKSLKHYTVTSDVQFQCQVLQLLSQLVQLRVNYCLLDSEQIFIGFVLKQFEFIEEGQITSSEELIPKIFQFLVHLSYGKQHSKSIIVIPKIIQLCDGLMASGQAPLTHCIPALKPIVEDVFLLRNKSNTSDFKELETTREVLVSMLLRLLEHQEIIDLFVLILNESKYCDGAERWLRWSRQVFDVFLPMLRHNRVNLDRGGCMESTRKLIFALHPGVFKNYNEVLVVLYAEPPNKDEINKYIGKVLVLLLILFQLNEDKLLAKIVENRSDFSPQTIFENVKIVPDPLNVTKASEIYNYIAPEVVFLRFLFRSLSVAAELCVDSSDDFLSQQISCLMIYFAYILQSGNYAKITDTAIELLNEEVELNENEQLPVDAINKSILQLRFSRPLLNFQWSYILTLLNYNERKYWSTVMQLTETYGINRQIKEISIPPKNQCINLEILRIGGSIMFSDYLSENILSDGEQMSWFLVNNIDFIVNYHNEAPVFELLGSIHRNSAASGLVIQAITTKCLDNPRPFFRTKILKCVENVHASQTGTLLIILIPKLLTTRQLAISRLVANLASRKIEYLLTLTMEVVTKQLPKEELVRIMELLVTLRLAKKHETLVSLLNKLSSQFYDLSPLDFDQGRLINRDYIRKLNVDKVWYLSQVRGRCNMNQTGAEAAELLSKLPYDDLITVMSHKDFNKAIMHECVKWGAMCRKSGRGNEGADLLRACLAIFVKDVGNIKSVIPKPHQVYTPFWGESLQSEIKYSSRLTEIFSDDTLWLYLHNIILPVTEYIRLLPTCSDLKITDTHHENFTKLAVLCLEMITFTHNAGEKNVDLLTLCLSCAECIFKETYLCGILALDTHVSWLCSAINSIYGLVERLLVDVEPLPSLPASNLSESLSNMETLPAGRAAHQINSLICWLEKRSDGGIPKCVSKSIRSIVISLARLPLVNSYILTPPTAWKSGWRVALSGPFLTQVPPLPIEYLQEIEILEEFIFRITLLGWTSRQQFEETWMCLLSVLSVSPTEHSSADEINAMTHSMGLAVQAITSLLLQTLYHPQPGSRNVSQLIHVPRDTRLDDTNTSTKKLKNLQREFHLKLQDSSKVLNSALFVDVFNKPNLEKIHNGYGYGQLSAEYLLVASRAADVVDESSYAVQMFRRRQMVLDEIGLDLNSCVQFFLDLYTQWIKSEQPLPLRLLQEVVKSILIISDIFNEKSQYQWMFDVCSELSKNHMAEDEIIHQYLVVALSKSVAVLSVDIDTYEWMKKLITQSLKSAFLSARIAAIHGLFYILQVCVLGNTVIGGVSDEMNLFLPIAVEYVQCHINSSNSVLHQSQEHTLLVWSLAFYVIENVEFPHLEVEFVESVLEAVLMILSDNKLNTSVYIPLVKGIERLLITKKLPIKISSRAMKFSLEKLRHSNPIIALPATQLLYSCMYIEYAEQLEHAEVSKGIDHLVQTIEKVSVIFDRIKKGYPFEVKILCESVANVLIDFFSPADILTKVITEYLSPQQRHPMELSKVVFQIFQYAIEQSQLSLLQDWVVFSLTNFTQSFSIGMATWCLTCFFISASTNEWLRAMFPYVQKRIGRYEYEDRKILCIAGADFYNNLKTDVQKRTFVDTLLKVKDQVDMPFNELLGCL